MSWSARRADLLNQRQVRLSRWPGLVADSRTEAANSAGNSAHDVCGRPRSSLVFAGWKPGGLREECGEKQDNWDVYVKMIGGVAALRLTTDPADDQFPAWSLTGGKSHSASTARQEVFTRYHPLGGPEHKIVDLMPLGEESHDRPTENT